MKFIACLRNLGVFEIFHTSACATKQKKTNICSKFFFVYFITRLGRPLGKVKKFKCRSMDWKNMTCIFNEMDNNIPITYELMYKASGFNGKRFPCKLINGYSRDRSCLVYSDTKKAVNTQDAELFKFSENLTFKLTSTFPESARLIPHQIEEVFVINHLASVVPAAPTALTATEVTTDSALLQWKMPPSIYYTSFATDFDLQIRSQFDNDWRSYPLETENSPKTQQVRLENLEYAYAQYDVRLRIKTHAAPDDDEMWSSFVEATFQTKSRVPDRPPTSTFGAFHINDFDVVTVYWQQLDDWESNGPNLHYTIAAAKQDGRTM